MTNYNLPNIRNLLTEGFTPEELLHLCFDTRDFKPVYDQLPPNPGKTDIIDRLLVYAANRKKVELVLAWAKECNPILYTKHQPYHLAGKKQVSAGHKSINWGMIGAIAAVVSVVIAICAPVIVYVLQPPTPTPIPPEAPNFEYQVHVQAKDIDEDIPNAQVRIEVKNKAPLNAPTDSIGIARIFISSSYSDQPGVLIVEATGYRRYRQNIDLMKDTLPNVVQLEPITSPSPIPTPCPYQAQTDTEVINRVIQAEAEAVIKEDISIIRAIFAPDATIRREDIGEQWNNPVTYYANLFSALDFTQATHYGIQLAEPEITGTVVYFTSGSRITYGPTGATPVFQDNPPAPPFNPSTPYGSEHWTLKKNRAGCWQITEFAFNAGLIPFPPRSH